MTALTKNFSRVATGFWRQKHWDMSDQQLLSFVQQHVEMGITTMDHAAVYNSEAQFGKALALDKSIRDDIQLVTKCGIQPANKKEFAWLSAEHTSHYNSSREHIVKSTEHSLRNLGTDYIDLLLIHRPDYLADFDEIAAAFEVLQSSGKVKYFGVSNCSSAQFNALQRHLKNTLITNQIEMSVMRMELLEDGFLEQAQEEKLSPMFWSCLAGGALLSSKSERAFKIRQCLASIGGKYDCQAIETIAYAWLLRLPSTPCVITGSSRVEKNKLAADAQHIKLSREDWYAILEASRGEAVP